MNSASPAVLTRESELQFRVQAYSGVNGAMVGVFQWGPIDEPTLITGGEEELVSKFYKPNDATAISFLSAANFLKYSNSLYVTRVAGSNAKNAVPTEVGTGVLIKNDDHYDLQEGALNGILFLGRYAGSAMNGVKIEVQGNSDYASWAYVDEFLYAPTEDDQFNLIVIDTLGTITGTVGGVIEKYTLLSTSATAKQFDGSSAYFKNAINSGSNFIRVGDAGATFTHQSGDTITLTGGIDDNDLGTVASTSGYDLLANPDTHDVAVMFGAGNNPVGVGNMVDVAETRSDCIACVSPEIGDVVNNITVLDDVLDFRNSTLNKNTSYAVMNCNWKLVYDAYNDVNRWIPCDSDVAGLIARTWNEDEPWFSPAGMARGQLKNVIRLAWNPDKGQRDQLYKASINAVVSFVGEGTMLYGDRTMLSKPSSFDRINVRSLFIIIRKSIARSARFQLFETNDDITRSLFRNGTNAFLDTIQSKRGITDKQVKCDAENNTPEVIDNNGFVASIFIKPAKSINTIELNFVSVAGDIEFSEIESS